MTEWFVTFLYSSASKILNNYKSCDYSKDSFAHVNSCFAGSYQILGLQKDRTVIEIRGSIGMKHF